MSQSIVEKYREQAQNCHIAGVNFDAKRLRVLRNRATKTLGTRLTHLDIPEVYPDWHEQDVPFFVAVYAYIDKMLCGGMTDPFMSRFTSMHGNVDYIHFFLLFSETHKLRGDDDLNLGYIASNLNTPKFIERNDLTNKILRRLRILNIDAQEIKDCLYFDIYSSDRDNKVYERRMPDWPTVTKPARELKSKLAACDTAVLDQFLRKYQGVSQTTQHLTYSSDIDLPPLLLPFSNRESKEFSRCVSVDIKNRRLILPQPTADAATWDEYCTFDASPLHSIETYVNIAHKRGKEKKCLHLCEK